jgi:hypothetical protein
MAQKNGVLLERLAFATPALFCGQIIRFLAPKVRFLMPVIREKKAG